MRQIAIFIFLLIACSFVGGQPQTIKNADVVNFVKANMSDETIVLAIERGPVQFDLSPGQLLELKKNGVSDAVLSAMLRASTNTVALTESLEQQTKNAEVLFRKAVDHFGPREAVTSIKSTRWKATVSAQTSGKSATYEVERITQYPDRIYMVSKTTAGIESKSVLTPDLSYMVSGKFATAMPSAIVESARIGLKVDPIFVAQHPDDYVVSQYSEDRPLYSKGTLIQIRNGDQTAIWTIDSESGELLSTKTKLPAGETIVDYSDWRQVGGVLLPFKRHVTEPQRISDVTISEYIINPAISANIFAAPRESIATDTLTFKVLRSESVPYVVQTGGGVRTNCSITGSTNTSGTAITSGNLTLGNATSTTNLGMSCNTQNVAPVGWRHVLNAMLIQASNGNAYIIACDAAWRWSKCTGLRSGDTFNARRTDKGILVQFFNGKRQEKEATYVVLQSQSLR